MTNMLYDFYILFSLFIIYSFLGWIFEVTSALITDHKLINRGFLIGPIIPIWGTGAVLITLILKPTDSIFNLIVSSAFIGTALEYMVNYLMEKIFKARWWDYSHLPFNIEGRVWLGSSALFGIGGLFLVKYINPIIKTFLLNIDKGLLCIISSILIVLVLADFCISCKIITKLKLSAYSLRKDYTEEVTKKVKESLIKNSHAFKRLLKAFPDVTFSFKGKK